MNHSLQFRVTVSVIAIVGVMSTLITLSAIFVSNDLEASLTSQIARHEAQAFASALREGKKIELPDSGYFRVFLVSGPSDPGLPAVLKNVPAGLQDKVHWDDKVYETYSLKVGDKWLYVTYDITDAEAQQSLFSHLLWIGVFLAIVFAAIAGILAGRLAVRPITLLADRVRTLPAETRGLRLSGEFSTPEAKSIAIAFDRYLARLDTLIERERSFTTDASHELRTPLAVISSTAELLQSQIPDDGRLREKIDRIRRSAKQLTRLTESLLVLAREDATEESVRINELLLGLPDNPAMPTDAAQRLRLNVQSQLTIQAPRAAVITIVHNLVGNALQHAGSGTVEVGLWGRVLKIRDHGPGMTKDLYENVFDRGFHAGASAGLGFGLYISKRLCARFGWQIQLTPAQGGGTSAIVRF